MTAVLTSHYHPIRRHIPTVEIPLQQTCEFFVDAFSSPVRKTEPIQYRNKEFLLLLTNTLLE